jgi:hypothetical protein
MLDQPTPVEMLDVLASYIRDQLAPQLPPHAVFHARVAANAIDLVRRQLESGAALESESTARLHALLGHDGDSAALEQELCERIRDGSIGAATPGLIEHLMASTLAKMSVDQPTYASYRRELAVREQSDSKTSHPKE